MLIRNMQMLAALLVLALGSLSVVGCNKDDDNTAENTQYAEDQTRLISAFNDLDIIPIRALTGNASSLAACASVSIDTTGALDAMTIDFGQQNCLCFDGKYRRGQLIVYYSGDYKDSMHYRRVEPSNYFLNDSRIMGTKEVTGRGLDNFGRYYYSVTYSGEVFTPNPREGSVEGSGNYTYAWTAGLNTTPVHDDVFEIDGVGEMMLNTGEKYTTEILQPLEMSMDCNWVRSGVVRITPENATRRSMDYGDGACDDRAEITINGATREVLIAL